MGQASAMQSAGTEESAGKEVEMEEESDAQQHDAAVVTLLQKLIQNACVNTGAIDSGHEVRSVATLMDYLQHDDIVLTTVEPSPGRGSLVATLRGTDPTAPTLGLLGHLDVVPASSYGWQHDPFSGHDDGKEIWGRGAVDMLHLTAAMAVALRHLAESTERPRGTVVFMAVADEEAGGSLGAGWLIAHRPELVDCDYVITEWGGVQVPSSRSGSTKLWVTTGQKGGTDVRLTFHGESAHASRPYGVENALVQAASAITAISQHQTSIEAPEAWLSYINSQELPTALIERLCDPTTLDQAIAELAVIDAQEANFAHACTRMTLVPTLVNGTEKINTIPGSVEVGVLARRLPSQTLDHVKDELRRALGELWDEAEVRIVMDTPPTHSSPKSPLWEALGHAVQPLVACPELVEVLTVGGNDGGYFRDRGAIVYGFGLASPGMTLDRYTAAMHGVNERIDHESLHLSVALFERLARSL